MLAPVSMRLGWPFNSISIHAFCLMPAKDDAVQRERGGTKWNDVAIRQRTFPSVRRGGPTLGIPRRNRMKSVFPARSTLVLALALAAAAPAALLIAIHLEALDHCRLSRKALRAAADRAGISAERLLIPADGERICC